MQWWPNETYSSATCLVLQATCQQIKSEEGISSTMRLPQIGSPRNSKLWSIINRQRPSTRLLDVTRVQALGLTHWLVRLFPLQRVLLWLHTNLVEAQDKSQSNHRPPFSRLSSLRPHNHIQLSQIHNNPQALRLQLCQYTSERRPCGRRADHWKRLASVLIRRQILSVGVTWHFLLEVSILTRKREVECV